MSDHNGSNGKEAVAIAPPSAVHATEIILSNGIKVWCYPIPARDRSKLVLQWNEQNPLPDKKAYQLPVPEDEATIPGQTLSAESNPEWQDVLEQRRYKLNDYLVHTFLVGYTDFPDNSEDELIARYARVIARKRKVMDLPADAWEATLRGAIVDNIEDEFILVQAIQKRVETTFEEVIDSVAIFRPVNSRHLNRPVPTEDHPQSAAAQTGVQQD